MYSSFITWTESNPLNGILSWFFSLFFLRLREYAKYVFVSGKKLCHFIFGFNFAKYWSVLKNFFTLTVA